MNPDELELRLASPISPMLLTVSIFSLTLASNIDHPRATYVDEILCLLSAFCVLGAATVTGSILDKANLSLAARFTFLSGGYFLFCVAAGVMAIVIPLLYLAKASPTWAIPLWQYILYFLTGCSVTAKLMHSREHAWTIGMFLLFLCTFCVLAVA